ncbi:MAG: hypothetical protein ABSD20_00430 [Terriglobales bacterium]|jgi:hypothetical protein
MRNIAALTIAWLAFAIWTPALWAQKGADINQVIALRQKADEAMVQFDSLSAERNDELLPELQRAVAEDFDETLLDVAFARIASNKTAMDSAAATVQARWNAAMVSARTAFRAGILNEHMFTSFLHGKKDADLHLAEPPPAQLTLDLQEARIRFPNLPRIYEAGH